MAYQHHNTGHNIDFDRTEIITEEKNYWRRRLIIEGMEIKKSLVKIEQTDRWAMK